MKILVTPTSFKSDTDSPAKTILEQFADEIIYNPYGRPLKPEEITILLDGVDGMIAGLDYITEDVIKHAPLSLKVISRYGAGYDRVDIGAAREKGIIVTNTPGVNSQSVADLAFGLMLSISRRIPILNDQIKHEQWPRYTGIELYKKTIGIMGLGAIGKGVAMRAKGFSMEVLAYDPYIDVEYAKTNNIKVCSFDEVISNSDFISLHLPYNEETKNTINAKTIARMRKNAIIINTSRGGLINEDDAYEALLAGRLGGLGLDAYEKEPPEITPLYLLDNVVLTPHSGAHTKEATDNMRMASVQNLIDVITNKECHNIVK